MFERTLAGLTVPLLGYNTPERVAHLAHCLYDNKPEYYKEPTLTLRDIAAEMRLVHDNSRKATYGFALAAAIALSGALFIQNTPAKVALSPTAALLLLLARDERRALKAAAPHIKSPQFKTAIQL